MRPDIVVVCGGRAYANSDYLSAALKALHKSIGFRLLVNGFADGADKLAYEWAKTNGIQPAAFPALWTWHRKKGHLGAAGAERNRNMLRFFDSARIAGVIGFPGGNGTADMLDQAHAASVRVIDLRSEPQDYGIVTASKDVPLTQ